MRSDFIPSLDQPGILTAQDPRNDGPLRMTEHGAHATPVG